MEQWKSDATVISQICNVDGVQRFDLHWINNLEIHLHEIANLLVTRNGKCLPRIAQCAIIIISFGRRPSSVERRPRVSCQRWARYRISLKRAPRARRARSPLWRGSATHWSRMVDNRLGDWGIARIHPCTSFDATAFSRAIKGTWDIKIHTILAST